MKISMDKKLTLIGNAAKVKNDMKEFKAMYTDGDLRRAFEDVTDYNCYGDIIKCDVSAANCNVGGDTFYYVEMIIDGWRDFKRISFYCDSNLTIDNEEMLLGYKYYSEKN